MSYGYYQPPPPKKSNAWIFVLLGCLFGGGFLVVAVCAGVAFGLVNLIETAKEQQAQEIAEFPSFAPPRIPTPGVPAPPSIPSYTPPAYSPPAREKVNSFDEAIAALNSGDTADDREAVQWLSGQPVDAIHKTAVTAGLVACLERKSQVRDVMPQLVAWAGEDVEPLLLGYLLDPETVGNDSVVMEESMRILHERNHPELASALVGLVRSGNVRQYDARRYLKMIGPSAADEVLPLMNSADFGARTAARELLDEYAVSRERRSAQALVDLDAEAKETRDEAVRYLREKGDIGEGDREALLTKLESLIEIDSSFQKFDNFEFYLKHADLDREDFVIQMATDQDHRVSDAAMKWLGQKASPRGLEVLGKAFVDPRMRMKAAPALKAAGPAAEEILWPLVDGGDVPTQIEAIRTLEAIGTEKTVTELQKKLRIAIARRDVVLTRQLQDAIEALKIRLTLEARRGAGSPSKPGTLETRVWTDATGSYTIEAAFVRRDGDVVTIRRKADGGEVDLPLDQLSDADRKYVDSVD